MIYIFPEIVEFFKQNQFTDTDLNELRQQIEGRYKDSRMRKAAESAINLQLLSFKLGSTKILQQKESGRILNKRSDKKSVVEHFLEITLNKPIIKVAIALDITEEELYKELKISDSPTSKKLKFTGEHWLNNKTFILDKLNEIKEDTSPKGLSRIKKSKARYNNNTTVFDKAKMYGGVGKLIYIRKK